MTDREAANVIKRTWWWRTGLLAIRARHPVRTWGVSLDLHPDHVAEIVREGREDVGFWRTRLMSKDEAAKITARTLAQEDVAKRHAGQYGFDILVWIAVAELVIRIAIWVWERWRP